MTGASAPRSESSAGRPRTAVRVSRAPTADDEDGNFSPAAYLPSPNADPASAVELSDWQEDAATRLQSAIETLDARSRDILESRWLGDAKRTLQELADQYGVSAERIRQLEANAIKKLRAQIVT